MIAQINEPIHVIASFESGKITPLAFSWQGRKYDKLAVISRWPVLEGKYALRYFSLFDGATVYSVQFIPQQFAWELVSIYSD